ncbi:uncharacterized protein V6R79_023637 [Siganus canaliculatus]
MTLQQTRPSNRIRSAGCRLSTLGGNLQGSDHTCQHVTGAFLHGSAAPHRHLLSNHHWRKGQRRSQQTESNDWDGSAPIAPLAEPESQDGKSAATSQRRLVTATDPVCSIKMSRPPAWQEGPGLGRQDWRRPDMGPQ